VKAIVEVVVNRGHLQRRFYLEKNEAAVEVVILESLDRMSRSAQKNLCDCADEAGEREEEEMLHQKVYYIDEIYIASCSLGFSPSRRLENRRHCQVLQAEEVDLEVCNAKSRMSEL
jgi:hypothetical protein